MNPCYRIATVEGERVWILYKYVSSLTLSTSKRSILCVIPEIQRSYRKKRTRHLFISMMEGSDNAGDPAAAAAAYYGSSSNGGSAATHRNTGTTRPVVVPVMPTPSMSIPSSSQQHQQQQASEPPLTPEQRAAESMYGTSTKNMLSLT